MYNRPTIITKILNAHISLFFLKSEVWTFVYLKDAFNTCNSLAERQRQVLTNAIERPANQELDKVLKLLIWIHVMNSRFMCKIFEGSNIILVVIFIF